MSPLMSVRQVAAYLSLSNRSVYRLVKSGRLRAYRPTQRVLRFKREEVERLTIRTESQDVMVMDAFIAQKITD